MNGENNVLIQGITGEELTDLIRGIRTRIGRTLSMQPFCPLNQDYGPKGTRGSLPTAILLSQEFVIKICKIR